MIIVTSINSVTVTVYKDTVKNVLLTDVRYYLLIKMSASKLFFTLTQYCCIYYYALGPSLTLYCSKFFVLVFACV